MKEIFLQNWQAIIIYILAVNVVGFLAMGIDKFKAQKGMCRTKEKTLFTLSLIGGSIGTLVGMYTFRHKTKHNTFVYGFPAILIAQVVLICYLFLM